MYPFIELDYTSWLEVRADLSTTTYYIEYGYEYIPFLVDTTNKIIYRTGIQRYAPASSNVLLSGTKASATIQDIFYSAVKYGTDGNSITITYTGDATAVGQEYVTVSDLDITVHIVDGESTAQQVVTAVTGWNAYNGLISNSSASAALVSAIVSGDTGNPQTAQGPTSLIGGADAVTVLSDFETNIKSSATQVASIDQGIADAI